MGWLIGLPLGIFRLLGGLLLLLARLALPLLLVAGAAVLLRRRRGRPAQRREPEFDGPVYTVDYEEVPTPSPEPDAPTPFGYKTCWLAVRTTDSWQVLEALGVRAPVPANWATGLPAAGGGTLFVSPCVDGFVLAVGLPGESRALPERLAARFSEVQLFATHRVTETHRWARYLDGALVREYGYAGESGRVLRDQGDWTPEELALGFGRFPRLGREDCEDFPDEEDVLGIAAAWGVDPRFQKKTYPPSAGWLCKMNEEETT